MVLDQTSWPQVVTTSGVVRPGRDTNGASDAMLDRQSLRPHSSADHRAARSTRIGRSHTKRARLRQVHE